MTRTLAFAWALHRLARSAPLAITALIVVAVLCVAIMLERQSLQRKVTSLAQEAQVTTTDPIAERDTASLVAWRQQLVQQAGTFPPRSEVSGIVRKATGIVEASGVSVESINTSDAALSVTPYQALTLEARMTGSAAGAASALSDVLVSSPGWAIERLSIERRREGVVSVEAVMVLIYKGAR